MAKRQKSNKQDFWPYVIKFMVWCCKKEWVEKTNSRWCRRRQWHSTPVLLPGKSYGRRSLVGCSPWGHEESGMTEWLHFHFSLPRIGEGNGNPHQCSCLENPRDGRTWWAAIYGVAQSRTRLKRLSSSSNDPLVSDNAFCLDVYFYLILIKLQIFSFG